MFRPPVAPEVSAKQCLKEYLREVRRIILGACGPSRAPSETAMLPDVGMLDDEIRPLSQPTSAAAAAMRYYSFLARLVG